MTPRVMIELVPAPAITAGIVNTPVPMMLPTTSAVADGRPRAFAPRSAGDKSPSVRTGAFTGASSVAVIFVPLPHTSATSRRLCSRS